MGDVNPEATAGDGAVPAMTHMEADEVRGLLDAMPTARPAVRRTTMARLRRLGVPADARRSRVAFDRVVELGAIRIDDDAAAETRIVPQPPGRVFRVSVGVTGDSVEPTWNAFDQRFQWFGKPPRQVTSGAHLFILAVDRWSSACVGLYEAVSAGAEKLPDSPDPRRWPYALGVRPLAAILPPAAIRVEGQTGPQSGLPEHVRDPAAIDELYRAVAGSLPPPGPRTVEQRVQELQEEDLGEDVLAAVRSLGRDARRPAIIDRAIEIGGWNEEELRARAWYTGSGTSSHVELVLGKALQREHVLTRRLKRERGSSPYVVVGDVFGTSYRRAGDRATGTTPHDATVEVVP